MIQDLLYFKCDGNKDWKNYTENIQHFTAQTSPSRQKACEASSASCWMNRREEKHSDWDDELPHLLALIYTCNTICVILP